MKSNTSLNCVCVFLVAVALHSCKKFVEIPSPVNQLNASDVFTDDKTATAAVVGIYSEMELSLPVSTYLTLLPGLSADELNVTAGDNGYLEFVNNNYTPNNQYSAAVWAIYSTIYKTNSCIQGIQNSSGLSPATKDQLLGEALFSRA